MTTFETPLSSGEDELASMEDEARPADTRSAPLSSPFALAEVSAPPTDSMDAPAMAVAEMSSPFLDGFVSDASAEEDEAVLDELLVAELEDEDFVDALEALANEASAMAHQSPVVWNEAGGPPSIDHAEAEQWMETIETRVDAILAELEERFADRSLESVGDDELDQALDALTGEHDEQESPLDAQDYFFKKLANKVKKAVKGAKRLVKKGIKLAKRFLPLGLIFRRLRPIIKPLLRRVLAKAIGKLPRSLRGPARRLAARYGLREAEMESDFEYLAAELDAEIVEAMTAPDHELEALLAELHAESEADAMESSMTEQLDLARYRLGKALEQAEPGEPPIEAMEQFIPVALLPIARMGIQVAGRRRVVRFLAGLLARLIAPVVGKRLARPLSMQIADKGLRLLKLESPADEDGLGMEAVVAATEEALHEVLELPEEWLENELLLEMAVEDAFNEAARRHFPEAVLRSDLSGSEAEDERGVWIMMPRLPGKVYRYKQYSQAVPVRITPRLARSVVFRSGETLEDRLYDEGIDQLPVNGELELYELLPEAELGHITADEWSAQSGSGAEGSMVLDELEEPGELPLPDDERRVRRSSRRRRRGRRQVVRITARGRALRRRSPVSVRLDLSGGQAALRLHVTVGERRAMTIVQRLSTRQDREVVDMFRRLTGRGMRKVVARRLQVMLKRRKITAVDGVPAALSEAIFDGLITALGSQIQALRPAIVAAAKHTAPGLTVTATFTFGSKADLAKGAVKSPTLTVRPGRHRD